MTPKDPDPYADPVECPDHLKEAFERTMERARNRAEALPDDELFQIVARDGTDLVAQRVARALTKLIPPDKKREILLASTERFLKDLLYGGMTKGVGIDWLRADKDE